MTPDDGTIPTATDDHMSLARVARKLGRDGLGAAARRAWAEARDLSGLVRHRILGPKEFELYDRSVPVFVRHYNTTWRNERCVELALAQEFVARHGRGRGLEIGNVLSHYFPVLHDVVDKYETAPGVRNEDVVDLPAAPAYDFIVAISTLEHVGWDEAGRDPAKAELAVRRLRSMLLPTGRMFVSCPMGYHPRLDRLIRAGAFDPLRQHVLVRSGLGWRQVELPEVDDPPSFEPGGRQAHAVWIAELGPPSGP
ncbi:MAG: hypothetical protein ACT4PW_08855 [Acidimicrobiia bacterium]